MGGLTRADNRDARISREYNTNGTLKREVQRIRTYHGSDFLQHVYELAYAYDLNGRRKTLTHPANLAPRDESGAALRATTYGYDPATGQLETVTDPLGFIFTHRYRVDGVLRQIEYGPSSGVFEEREYDDDNRLRQRLVHGTNGPIADTLHYGAPGKLTRVHTDADTMAMAYSGLGTLARSYTWDRRKSSREEELYTNDALGNRVELSVLNPELVLLEPTARIGYEYEARTGRLLRYRRKERSAPVANNGWGGYEYDESGNVRLTSGGRYQPSTLNSGTTGTVEERTMQYYGADGRLRVVDRRSCFIPGTGCDEREPVMHSMRSAFQEYRYDALGRRILVRTRSEWVCHSTCGGSLRRVVWDGDQLLYEIQAYGGSKATDAQLEQDVGLVIPPSSTRVRDGFYGRVAYTHGLGLDEPLALIRMDYGFDYGWDPDNADLGPQVLVPHTDARGQYRDGSFLTNPCTKVLEPTVNDTDPPSYRELCMSVSWPGREVTPFRRTRNTGLHGPASWMGELLDNTRDASGMLYMRNRYYDPQSGRFTQEDPIGLAGGLNLYGFANGDPVSYSDPYGLSAEECCDRLGFEGDPKNVERAVQYSQNASTGERVLAGVLFAGANAALLPAALPAIVVGGRRVLRNLTQAADDGVSARTPVGHRGKTLQVQLGSNRPTTIGGRRYTGHALDRMQERGLTPSSVEDAIRHGTRSAGNDPGTFVHVTDAAKVVTGRTGNVITVMPK